MYVRKNIDFFFFFRYLMKTNKLGGSTHHPHPMACCLCIVTSNFSRTCFCSVSLPLTAPKQTKKTPNPVTSPTFLWITRFEYCKEKAQSKNGN